MKTRNNRIAAALGAAVAWALPALADAATLETSGEFRARAWSLHDHRGSGRSDEFWDQRLRLNLDWSPGGPVGVHARADLLEGPWGEAAARAPVVFDQACLQFIPPGTPLRVTVGRQDATWGTGYWVQDDRDRFAVGLRLDPVAVLVAYDKLAEVTALHGVREDAGAWAVGAIADAGGHRVGLLVARLRDASRTRFPAGDLTYWAGGLFAVGRVGPVDARAEFVCGTGSIDRPAVGDLEVRGIGGYASASLPLGPLRLTLEGAYAGGDDPKTPGRNEGFFSADYQGPFNSLIFYNTLDIAGYAGDAQSSSPEADFSVRNARALKASASFAPLKRLNLTAAALYAAADRTPPGVDRALGWEFDMVAVHAVTERVNLSAGVGCALLGDYWKSAPMAAGTGRKPENPLAFMVAFTTAF